ncbi:MAG: HEAT repeat domain-containing protein, partial [Sedimentisphaerales bacterium]|nr:HEAT repeat domain-containing protein [Sedimentisphaerales bacterium]
VVQKALEQPEPEVGRAAIKLLDNYISPDILPVIEQALKSADEQIRVLALNSLSTVNDPKVAVLLTQALNDKSKEVRSNALEVTEEHDSVPIRISVLERAITSTYNDVKYEAVSMLQDVSGNNTVEILIEGLKDNDPKFREAINESLNSLIKKRFRTYEEAQTWWRLNKDQFNKDTSVIDDI